MPTATPIPPTATPTETPTSTPVVPTATPTSTPVPPTSTPTSTPGPISRLSTNTANFNNCADWNGQDGNVTTVGSNGIASPFNIYDMTGNVWEWITTNSPSNPANKICRGGSWATTNTTHLSKAYRGMQAPSHSSASFGFRIFTINNIYSLSNFAPIQDTFEGSGNPADATTWGSVNYAYFASREPVTNAEYSEFLNAVAATDTNNVYDTSMGSHARGGIIRSGTPGSYSYSCKTNMENKPVNYVMWYNAARYCNWLHNNKPTGLQSASTTEDGAYLLNGNNGEPNKFNNAKYFLPSDNEWYKAAYYASLVVSYPTQYYTYATKSDTLPSCVSATATGDGAL